MPLRTGAQPRRQPVGQLGAGQSADDPVGDNLRGGLGWVEVEAETVQGEELCRGDQRDLLTAGREYGMAQLGVQQCGGGLGRVRWR